jgi:hypothetical protein
MKTTNFEKNMFRSQSWATKSALLGLSVVLCSQAAMPVWAVDPPPTGTGSTTVVNTGTGYTGNTTGNGNVVGNDVVVGGDSENINHNTTGNNTNQVQASVYNPNGGGSAALVLPRNPLSLSNALMGRSNFGLQFGLQNNPNPWGGGSGGSGLASSLGWFVQGGVTIPFGKIPAPFRNQGSFVDDARQLGLDRDRNVFGQANSNPEQLQTRTNVGGRIIGLNAYNYSTVPTGKIGGGLPAAIEFGKDGSKPYQPKLLALAAGDVYTRPLNTGERTGVVEIGKEYPYLGHIRAQGSQPGWIKILMPNGTEGWVSTKFEFVKTDFTEIDDLAVAPAPKNVKVGNSKAGLKPIKLSQVPKRKYSVAKQ